VYHSRNQEKPWFSRAFVLRRRAGLTDLQAFLVYRQEFRTPWISWGFPALLRAFATRFCYHLSMKIKGLYEKRGWWYYQPPTGDDGVSPKAIALRTQDSEGAVRLAFDERERMQLVTAAVSGRMSQAIAEYLRDRAAARKHTAKTAYNTERYLRQICADLKHPKIADLTPEKLATWANDLCGRDCRVAMRGADSKVKKRKNARLSDATIAAYSRVFRAFVTWAYKKGNFCEIPRTRCPQADPSQLGKSGRAPLLSATNWWIRHPHLSWPSFSTWDFLPVYVSARSWRWNLHGSGLTTTRPKARSTSSKPSIGYLRARRPDP